ncbi:hypothetical protein OG223_52465 [Streptomyces sp. NBC_01478]|uniref:hypothetical protein n=1 Tax=Streptomyces sp. NBC_01478 TaxID=2903882 RepID=UPI002E337752|nr:hypothetical protein [Streptomyces sp. NBC_01478]
MEARMRDALVGVMKEAYTAGLGEGAVPRPVMMPLVHGELVGLIWVRPLKVGQDVLVRRSSGSRAFLAFVAASRSFTIGSMRSS